MMKFIVIIGITAIIVGIARASAPGIEAFFKSRELGKPFERFLVYFGIAALLLLASHFLGL